MKKKEEKSEVKPCIAIVLLLCYQSPLPRSFLLSLLNFPNKFVFFFCATGEKKIFIIFRCKTSNVSSCLFHGDLFVFYSKHVEHIKPGVTAAVCVCGGNNTIGRTQLIETLLPI